jgi:hypothetical protein
MECQFHMTRYWNKWPKVKRYELDIGGMVYNGNEQDYHFKVMFFFNSKAGFHWQKAYFIYHMEWL